MAEYTCTFVPSDFSDHPETQANDIISSKFLNEHGVVVDSSMVAVDENGLVKNTITPDLITIVVDVSEEFMAADEVVSAEGSIIKPTLWSKVKKWLS